MSERKTDTPPMTRTEAKMPRYVAVVGLNYPDGKGGETRVEPGQSVPAALVAENAWLLEQGCVRAAEEAP